MKNEESKRYASYTADVLYFGTYMAISDRRLFYDEWKKLIGLIDEERYSELVYQNMIAIIRDMDNKPEFDTVVNRIATQDIDVKETALYLAFEIAYSDGTLGDVEDELLNQMRMDWALDKYRFETIRKAAKDCAEEKKSQVDCNSSAENPIFKQQYKELCDNMEEIAKTDIQYSMSVLNDATKQLHAYPELIQKQVDRAAKASVNLQDKHQKEAMLASLNQLTNTVGKVIEDANQNLTALCRKQKELSAHFTISFMGRTKAGKSTIHSILLGDINNDFIGQGSERTTRYNYVYDYNGIRIIDTPGIGAPNGQTDTEIAKEVADESDLICYVVTSDSVQETEFAFLQHLKEKNKPVIILLNKKENFVRSSRMKERFLENPLDWYTRTGEDAIQGHIDRITEYVRKHFHYNNYTIIPVQLLAAKLAMTENDPETKEQLMKGSRVKEFMDTLFYMINNYGTLQKSQTIYNSSIYYLNQNIKLFQEQATAFQSVSREFQKDGNACMQKIKKLTETSRDEIIRETDVLLNDFITQELRQFAYHNYNKKKENIKKEWKQFLNDSNIEKIIGAKHREIWDSYVQDVEDVLQETEENINFSVEFGELSQVKLAKVVDANYVLGITVSVVDIIGTIAMFIIGAINLPAAVVAIITVVTTIVAKNIQKAAKEKEKSLYESLKSNMEEIRETILKATLKKIDASAEQVNHTIQQNFTVIHESLEKIQKNMQILQDEQQTYEDQLNRLYAMRIANYIVGDSLYDLADEKSSKGLTVERQYGKQLIIKDDKLFVKRRKNDLEKVSGILQETIKITEGE